MDGGGGITHDIQHHVFLAEDRRSSYSKLIGERLPSGKHTKSYGKWP